MVGRGVTGVIERDVPVPERTRRLRDARARLLAALAPGQSMVFDVSPATTRKRLSKLAHRLFGSGHYRTDDVIRAEDGERVQVRVWRT